MQSPQTTVTFLD